jgi:peptide/nickel transport system substrate-binding protein
VQEESSQRWSGLEGGQFDVTHGSGGNDLSKVESISGVTTQLEPKGRQEISHVLVNVERPPLNDIDARRAVALAVDRDKLNLIDQKGTARYANQVVDTEIMGYVEDPGFPSEQNLDEAKKLVKKVKDKNNGQFAFTIATTFDQSTQTLFKEVKRQLGEVGIDVTLAPPVDQATLINNAIGGTTDAFGWRNYPGQDPDTLYVWFYKDSVVNFNHVDDPVINEALDAGRSEPDPSKRREHYETFNKQMSEQVYNWWTWYTQWFVAHKSNVHGIGGPNLPDDTGAPGSQKPVEILAGIHQILGMWKSQ